MEDQHNTRSLNGKTRSQRIGYLFSIIMGRVPPYSLLLLRVVRLIDVIRVTDVYY